MLHINTIRAVNDHTTTFLILGLVLGATTLPSAGVSAATFTVNTTGDTHDSSPGDGICRDTGKTPKCSLRAAIEEANNFPGRDSVKLLATTYALSIGTLPVTDDIDILGVSRTSTRIDGKGKFRVFQVGLRMDDFPFTYFADVTIQNGKGVAFEAGGGVYIASGQFVGDRVVITGNQSTSLPGGGVAVGGQGEFACTDCTISNNKTPTSNSGGVQYSGGGLYIYSNGGAWLYRTTISGNTAVRGGGIAGSGYLEMQSGTISGNTAVAGGGGIKTMYSDANWWIAWSTITQNKANSPGSSSEPSLGGGVFHSAGSLQIGKTIIGGNCDGQFYNGRCERSYEPNFSPDCATTSTTGSTGPYAINRAIISHWDNLYGNLGNICAAASATDGGDVSPYDRWGYGSSTMAVNLGPLQNNGGYVSTHQLLSGSIAIDDAVSGNPTGFWLFDCPTLDATQSSRPRGAYCDDGSYEAR